MILVDTCVRWIEWLADGALADQFRPYLEETEALVDAHDRAVRAVQVAANATAARKQAMKAIARATRSR